MSGHPRAVSLVCRDACASGPRLYVLNRFRKPAAKVRRPVPNSSMLVGSGTSFGVPSPAKPVGFPLVGAMCMAKCVPVLFASNISLAEENPPVRLIVKLKLVTPGGLQQESVTSKFPKPSICPPAGLNANPAGKPVMFSPATLPTTLNPKIPLFAAPVPNAVKPGNIVTVTSMLLPFNT